ncbi:MAG: hypothetical protein WDW38_007052 [Sanguina aurantia]
MMQKQTKTIEPHQPHISTTTASRLSTRIISQSHLHPDFTTSSTLQVYLPSTTKLDVVILEAALFHVWTAKTHRPLYSTYAPFDARVKALLLAHTRLSNALASPSSSITSNAQRSGSDSSSAVETAIVSALAAASAAGPGLAAAANSSSLLTCVGRLNSPMCSSDSGSPSQLSFLHSSPGQLQQQQTPIPGIDRSWETAKPNDGNTSGGSGGRSPEPRHSPSLFDRLMSASPPTGKPPSPVGEGSEQSSSPGSSCMLLHALLRGLKRRKDNPGPSPPTSLPPAAGSSSSSSSTQAGSGAALAACCGPSARRSLFTPTPQLLPVQATSDLGVLPLDVLLCVIPFLAPSARRFWGVQAGHDDAPAWNDGGGGRCSGSGGRGGRLTWLEEHHFAASEPWTGSPQQVQTLKQLQQRFVGGSSPAPDEETLKWYLRDRYFDVTEAEEKLRSMLRWRSDFQPSTITRESVAAEFKSGKAYVHAHCDVYGRPVVFIKTKLHVTGQYPIRDSKKLAVLLIDDAISRLPAGGEQILGIFDLRDFSLQNADFEFAAFMVDAFFEYYPRRVGQVLMVEAPWVFTPAWEVIKPLLRKYKALVRFVSVSELKGEFFTPSTAPPDF